MDRDAERRKAFEDFYSSLSPEERRGRLFLKPEFRDAYNELVQAQRFFPVPEYLWSKWVPILGVFPVGVYLELRRMCFWNPATGEKRDICWPRQETIARRLGVAQRQTVGRALRLLEEHGFIERERSYRLQGRGDGSVKRAPDRYRVFFEIPLLPEDAAELLARQTTPKEKEGGYRFENRTCSRGPVDKSGYTFEDRTKSAVRKTDSRTITGTITSNVSNVRDAIQSGPRTATPAESHTTKADRARLEALSLEIGESLSTMSGLREAGPHKSAAFHRLVASRLPETLIREALMAARDAVDDERAGRKALRSGPSAYFAGIVKRLAEANGIDLGLKPGDRAGLRGQG